MTKVREKNQTNVRMITGGILSICWLFIWFVRWQDILNFGLWAKTGIALTIFIIPGTNLFFLIQRNHKSLMNFMPFLVGFVFSHLTISLFGLFGRLFQFSFAYVYHAFMSIGLILILFNALDDNNKTLQSFSIQNIFTYITDHWTLFVIAGLVALMTIQRVITSDDLAYIAHITNWQNMPTLNLLDVYYGAEKVESTRFWIISTPFSQAFLSELSGIPALILLSGYYDPFLSVLSILSIYELSRTLKLSKNGAYLAVILQIVFIALLSDYLNPGSPFLRQLSTDKATAAFIFSPILIICAIHFLRRKTKADIISVILVGIGLSVMHPIMAAYTVFIVIVISLLGINQSNLKKNIILISAVSLTLAPQVAIRLVNHEAQPKIPYTVSESSQNIAPLVLGINNTPFYGFHPAVLKMRIPYEEHIPIPNSILSWSWIVVPTLATVASIKNFREKVINQYIVGTSILILLAGVPITGWLLGYFVSAWMLERTTWLFQFGVNAVFLILFFRDHTKIGEYTKSWKLTPFGRLQTDFAHLVTLSIWVMSTILILLFMREQGLPNLDRLEKSTNRYQELSNIGNFIDENAPGLTYAIATDELNDFIPSLSWKAKVISYRPEDKSYPYFYSVEENEKRWGDRQVILSRDTPPQVKMEMIGDYQIGFILLENYRLGKIKGLLNEFPTSFHVHTFGRYTLIEKVDFSK